MKQLHLYLLVLTFSLFGQQTFAQWYFETGVNDAKFTKYNDNNPTTLNSYAGFRDFSHAIGYMFPGKKLDERAQPETKAAALRFRIGVGFDQMGLRIKAVKAGSEALHHYDLGQFQAHGGVMFAPTLIRKKQADYYGVRQPAVNLILDAGLSYNFYTSATRTLINGSGSVKNLRVDNEFKQSFPAFTFGAGFDFPLNKYTAIYTKYEVENTFNSDEDTNSNTEETFSTFKRRAIVGLRIDFRLKNRLKRQQLDRIAALEDAKDDSDIAKALDTLQQKVDKLEEAITSSNTKIQDHSALQAHIQNTKVHASDIQNIGAIFKLKGHSNGFMYLPSFKHVLFPLNSSNFNKVQYRSKLVDLAWFLQENPNYSIKLIGYADAETGSDKYNLYISAKRAKRVYDYLINLGVPANRMEHKSYGGTLEFSLGDDLTYNRRTEILIFE